MVPTASHDVVKRFVRRRGCDLRDVYASAEVFVGKLRQAGERTEDSCGHEFWYFKIGKHRGLKKVPHNNGWRFGLLIDKVSESERD